MTAAKKLQEVTTAPSEDGAHMLEHVLTTQDLGPLSAKDRVLYYQKVCESIGLNPYTKPFEFLKLEGGLKLYATRNCADQLRALHEVNIDELTMNEANGIFTVKVVASSRGRKDQEVGTLAVENLKGHARANAVMKAVTKAKRRVTLSICGLGWLDETEVETIAGAEPLISLDQADQVNEAVALFADEVEKDRGYMKDKVKKALAKKYGGLPEEYSLNSLTIPQWEWVMSDLLRDWKAIWRSR